MEAFVKKLFDETLDRILDAKILPSVVFAQGILESDWGTSELAVEAHNLFGIKSGSGWSGPTYVKKTKERTKEGKEIEIVASFRKYETTADCVSDLLLKYTTGTGWEKFNRYEKLIGEKDFRKACHYLLEAKYATDVDYPGKLIRIIERYNLDELDPTHQEEDIELSNVWLIDAGHGGSDPGAVANGIQEKVWNLEASKYISKRLRDHGIKVVETRTTDKGIESNARGSLIKNSGAKKGLSLHFNAAGASARGFEFIHSIYSDGKFENILKDKFVKGDIPFRRIFTRKGTNGDYYFIHRLTGTVRMTIVEFGFLTNKSDVASLDTVAEREKYYEYVVEAVCQDEKIAYKKVASAPAKPKPAPAPAKPVAGTVWRVIENGKQTGAYKDPMTAIGNAIKKGIKKIEIEKV